MPIDHGQPNGVTNPFIEILQCPICRTKCISRRDWQVYCGRKCATKARQNKMRYGLAKATRRVVERIPAVEVEIGMKRGYCGACDTQAFVIDGALQCCGAGYNP